MIFLSLVCLYGFGVVFSFIHMVLKGKNQRAKHCERLTTDQINDNNFTCCYVDYTLFRVKSSTLAILFPLTYLCILGYSLYCFFEKSTINLVEYSANKVIALTSKPSVPELESHKTYRG